MDELLYSYKTSNPHPRNHLRYHYDARGNVAFILDYDGAVVERYSYDVFGTPTITDWAGNRLPQSVVGNRFMFQGREWIKELGLYDYRRRMYHPGLGRFLQVDPLGLQTEGDKLSAGQKALFSPGSQAPEAFTTSETNLYRYCHNDPINKVDPMGLLEFEIEGDKAFQAQVRADIARIESKPYGAAAMQELRDSPFRNVIVPGKENLNYAHDGKASTNGKGSGSTTEYNPNQKESGADTSGKTTRPGFIGLAHELAGHAVEKTRGQHNPESSTRNQKNKIPPSEKGAIKAENEVRKEHGLLPRRDFYLYRK